MAMVYNIPKFLEYTLKSNTIRTNYDLQDQIWANISHGSNHFDLLKSYPDNAESGANYGESY